MVTYGKSLFAQYKTHLEIQPPSSDVSFLCSSVQWNLKFNAFSSKYICTWNCAFSFNIHYWLIIKGMYLNYKYTSYTEVGKAGT